MQLDPMFAPLLADYRLDQLDHDSSTIYGLWRGGRIAYTNAGWRRFAENNGGEKLLQDWSLGANAYSAFSGPMRDFYVAHINTVVERHEPWEHRYQCPSARFHRDVQMRVLPLGNKGVLLVNSIIAEVPANPEVLPSDIREYLRPGGVITQCSHCRRFRRIDEQRRWDWIPQWLERSPPDVSHGLCEVCLGFYYADDDS